MEALLFLLPIALIHHLTWLTVKVLVQINAIPLRWNLGSQRIPLSLTPVTRISVLGLVYTAFFIFFIWYIIYHPWHTYEKWSFRLNKNLHDLFGVLVKEKDSLFKMNLSLSLLIRGVFYVVRVHKVGHVNYHYQWVTTQNNEVCVRYVKMVSDSL